MTVQRLVMVNYACGFTQSETGKYFEWIIIIIVIIIIIIIIIIISSSSIIIIIINIISKAFRSSTQPKILS